MAGILIIDDDTFICKTIQKQLVNKGFQADVAFSGNAGIKLLKERRYDLVLCDFRLPDKDGLEILHEVKRMNIQSPVVIITAYADVRMAVKLMKHGARDYMTKPLQQEEIVSLAQKLSTQSRKTKDFESPGDFLMGETPAFKQSVKYASKVAPTNMSVLIEGETGTGKEYVARFIHDKSNRNNKPFVAVDCGAIPKELAGSELFGHVKGSFTGALENKTGVFQQANGGTLFLDEIGNLSYEVQIQLLRSLQERTITRIGENKPQKVDVRVITATNENLVREVADGHFREDLLHRINEFKIVLPPLRQRPEDILFFANHFRKMANQELNADVKGFSDEVNEILIRYEWPGNIRELKNVIKRAVLLCSEAVLSAETLPEEIVQFPEKTVARDSEHRGTKAFVSLKNAASGAEKELIIRAIEEAGYNKSKAARNLQIDRKTLYNKIKQYGIDI
ncbi:two-component system, NtrC family, response regulator HydG [Mariniphaga anaerophila]|uniref:Two-component system, NtrC family, response regulator HydG n=1 Tax=Mariniphaga anaerophila TaxID=1484053 RepID=A0A1M4Y9M2_9BACT|nr:sigma-54 dependent transcriptional regulator [Mariniphaga anaerophila]SHF02333.1 two-component system, NtrC family, response regulator HydG [Mariniphaga anaerophila]